MLDNPAFPALCKIVLTVAAMLFVMHRRRPLWCAILVGAVLLGSLFGLSPTQLVSVSLHSLFQPAACALFGVVFCIMLLSAIQEHAGQGRRLVAGLTPYLKSPRLRLAFFPALVGLLTVAGGAIFSCPLVRDVAEGYAVSPRRQVLINYWFRHIWESAWPLYPGYIMTCILADIPPSLLWRYTFPIVIFNCVVGWLYFLRTPVERLERASPPDETKRPLPRVLLDALPLAVGIGLAPLFSAVFAALGLNAPGGSPFVASFFCAAAVAMFQNKVPIASLPSLMLSPHVGKMLGLVLMIFVFKDIVIATDVVNALAGLAGTGYLLLLVCILPMLTGMLTGIMLGFVGAAFPLLLALIEQSGLYNERLCWIILALSAGHFGQMISPMHSCYLVTLEFFAERLTSTWPPVFLAASTHLALCCAYVTTLYYCVHPLLP